VSPRNWLLRIEDIVAAIAAIQNYTQGMTIESFVADGKTVDAVMHNIMVIGEAASRVPDDVAARFSDIPWDKLRAIRNVVVHAYFGIRKEILWQTIRGDLPPLFMQMKRLLANEQAP
jgi:uncharacterized protein with HEPN domain